jgi:hypothetical protein
VKVRDGAWFLGKCSKCQAKTMVRKFKSVQLCIEDAKQMILNHTGSTEEIYGRPAEPMRPSDESDPPQSPS